MKKNIKKIIFSSVLALPLFLSPIVSASSSVDLSTENNGNSDNYSELGAPSPVPVIADGGGEYRVPVSKVLRYSVGSSYPKKVYAETYYKNTTLTGYIPATNAYLDNGYLVVTYYGILTN